MKQASMKGIILAGGSGSRLYPVTQVTCKQLLPVYDKPMIYYALATLMQLGIKDILIITTPDDLAAFQHLLGDGSRLGLGLSWAVQEKPEGIAQALVIGASFIDDRPVALILGDNIFYGADDLVGAGRNFDGGAVVFGYYMKDPRRYGVIEFEAGGRPVSIVEKPEKPKSNFAVTGLYMYEPGVVDIAAGLKPSRRGELEISDINNHYLREGRLKAVRLSRGVAWLDAGTHDSLLAAGNFIATIEKRQGVKIACIEEIAFRMGFIDRKQFVSLVSKPTNSAYKEYLLEILKDVDHEK